MEIIRDGKCIKIIPKKYEDVFSGLRIISSGKRLHPDERIWLLKALVRRRFELASKFGRDIQMDFAAKEILNCDDFDIIRVDKRDHIQWRVATESMEINVSSDLVSDCPEGYLKHKNEF